MNSLILVSQSLNLNPLYFTYFLFKLQIVTSTVQKNKSDNENNCWTSEKKGGGYGA